MLLGLADTSQGAATVLTQVADLGKLLGRPAVRWLVHAALLRLCAEEQEGSSGFFSLSQVRGLQRAYTTGLLDLDSLVPLERSSTPHPVFFLPGLRGRQETRRLAADDVAVYSACCSAVPWLEAAWRACSSAGIALYLTGSMLSWALRGRPAAEEPPPADVDIFILTPADLPRAVQLIMGAAGAVLGEASCGAVAVNATKYRASFEVEGPGAKADIYAHPLSRIQSYHFSHVRVAFDGTSLHCCASAAVALATGLNLDFNMRGGSEKLASVLFKKWQQGWSLLVREEELRAFLWFVSRNATLEQLAFNPPLTSRLSAASLKRYALHLRPPEPIAELYRSWRR
jgi:hypothetical protein